MCLAIGLGLSSGICRSTGSPIKEETLSLRLKYQTILTQLAPAGAVGVSLALGAAAPAAASTPPATGDQPTVSGKEGVSERLAAVRDAVTDLDLTKADAAKAEGRLAWGNWGYGWGWPNWNNWHNWPNWRNFWRNW
jgi:hypothetical protein